MATVRGFSLAFLSQPFLAVVGFSWGKITEARPTKLIAGINSAASDVRWWAAVVALSSLYIAWPALVAKTTTSYERSYGQAQQEFSDKARNLKRDYDSALTSQLGAQRTKYETKLTDAQSKIDTLNQQAADSNRNIAQSQRAASDWQERYVEVVAQIAGKDFAMELFNAQIRTDMSKASAEEADAQLASAQMRFEKKFRFNNRHEADIFGKAIAGC